MAASPSWQRHGLGLRAGFLTVLLSFVLFQIAGTEVARAHATLVGSSPAAGEILKAAPSEVRLWFSEDVVPLGDGIRVLGPSGERVDQADVGPGANARSIRASLAAIAVEGTMTVEWSVVSLDGHPLRGTFSFAVGSPTGGSLPPGETQRSPGWVTAAGTIARGIAYGAGLLLTGLLVLLQALRAVMGDPAGTLRRAGVLTATCLVGAAAAVLLAEALLITNGDWGTLLDAQTREAVWDGRHGTTAALVAAGGVLALFLGLEQGAPRASAALTVVLVAFGFAWSGHPAATEPAWVSITVDAVHVAAAGTWFGGLAGLAMVTRASRHAPDTVAIVARKFSAVVTIAAPLAVAAGFVLAWRVAPDLGDPLDNGYVRLLIAKVGLVAGTLAIAAWQRQVVLPRLRSEEPAGVGTLRRLVVVEFATLAAVVVVTASLVGEPPRNGNAASGPSDDAPIAQNQGVIGPYHVVMALLPGQAGTNSVSVELHATTSDPPALPPSISVMLTRQGSGDAVPASLRSIGQGTYAGVATLPSPGKWKAVVTVEVAPGRNNELQLEFDIRR